MSDQPIVASVQGVSKRFLMHKDKSVKERLLNFGRNRRHREDFWALRDVSIDIRLGSTVGLIGHNGSGKSTLLKVIGGIVPPTSGTVIRRGKLASLLELGTGFHPDLTGRENVFLNAAILGLRRSQTAALFDEIVDFSGIAPFIDTPVKYYSSGMYVRLAFAVAVHVDPDILLVDEVLAVGDEAFQRKCMDKIAQFQAEGRAIVFVSHSAEQIGRLCDRVVVLDDGELIHDGDPATGLSILRNYYVRQEISDAAGDGEEDGRTFRIRSIATSAVPTGPTTTDLQIDASIEVGPDAPEWGVRVRLENTLGLAFYEVNTFDLGQALTTRPGMRSIGFRLPELPLAAGPYEVVIATIDRWGQEYVGGSATGSLEIPPGGPGTGLLRVAPEVRVDEPD
ncbi:MAG TPA: ABC transporter ATP-binding protein [Microbacteriaceae bacterium]|nr:ABC transporter ATP-binding protein [Microbacteriaceae bacterium]